MDYHDFDPEAPPQPRLISTTLDSLNGALGGGLAAGGALSMSLVAAPSGVGKTTFACQQAGHWLLNQGHWVLYVSGEMPANYIFDQVTRIQARISESQRLGRIPIHHEAFRRAHTRIKGAVEAGRFSVYDSEDLSPEVVMELARHKQKELSRRREIGEVGPDACLIVVMDNWDNLFTNYDLENLREDQVFRRWMQRFQQQAAHYGYHHMNLAQTNGEAEAMKEAARADQMEGSKKLNAKSSHHIVLYRPRDVDAVERARSEGGELPDWAKPQIAVRKSRGGGRTTRLFCLTDDTVGDWHDAEDAAPF